MSTRAITIAVCCRKDRGRVPMGVPMCDQTAAAIEREGNQVTIRVKTGQETKPARHAATIRVTPDNPECHTYSRLPDPGLIIAQAARKTVDDDAPLEALPYILMRSQIPEHCHWRLSRAYKHGFDASVGALGTGVGAIAMAKAGDGNAATLPVLPWEGAFQETHMRQIEIAPGEWVEPGYQMSDDAEIVMHRGRGQPFATASLSGGRVLAVVGDYGTEDIHYMVGMVGKSGEIVAQSQCTPSDHVEYQIGDWVFVALGAGCEQPAMPLLDVDGQAIEGGGLAPSLQGGVILPLVCGNFKAQGPNFQALPLPGETSYPAGDLLAFCLLIGTIIEVYHPEGVVDVEMPWGRVDSVPVHYHCPQATGTAGGHGAFQADDEVLVVSSREAQAAHAVVGFSDGMPRLCKEYVVISMGLGHMGGASYYSRV